MAVTVRLFAAARSAAGAERATAAPGTLQSVVAELTDQFPGLTEVLPRCSFLVDGVAVHGDHSRVAIADSQEVDVLPPFAGG